MSGRPVQLPTHRQCEGTIAHAPRGIDPELTAFAEKMKSQTESRALVTEGGQLVGLVSLREMVFRYIPERENGGES